MPSHSSSPPPPAAGGTNATEAIRAALRGYDPSGEQWDAIRAPLEPQWIVAGAGSGKTAVMTARIVWLVEQQLVRPGSVLGLTFTNKASRELEERLTQALASMRPEPLEAPTVLTYHAFAASIVREHGPRLGIAGDAALLSEAQKWQILMGLVDGLPRLEELELRHPLSFIPQTLGLAGQCADHLITPADLATECERLLTEMTDQYSQSAARKRKDFAQIIERYQKAKREAGRIDFGDQITIAVELLTRFGEVRDGYRDRFRVVLLDEYQDTNPAQKRLLQQLCPPGSAVTAVGDARQAIYAWRGATMFNLIHFDEDFPRADGRQYRPTSLATNYRSGSRIVQVANTVISPVSEERRPGQELQPAPQNGEGFVGVCLFTDEEAEAEAIATEIERLHDGRPAGPDDAIRGPDPDGPVEWRDIAILVRKRRYMDRIVATLEKRDIPVEVPELGGLLKVPPVVDLVAWLRVLSDPGPSTNRWAARLMMGPRFRVHYRDLVPIARWAAEQNRELTADLRTDGVGEPDPGEAAFSLIEALEAAAAGRIEGLQPDAAERIGEFAALRVRLRLHASRPLAELARAIIDESGIGQTLAASPSRTAESMAAHLQTFVSACAAFSPIEGEPTLDTFLAYLDAAEESEDAIPVGATAPSDSVKVMTVHAAKGLEFEVVFLPVMAAQQETNRDGWRIGSVFPDIRTANPLRSAGQLPPRVRRDAQWLPAFAGNVAKFGRDLRERAEEDERRLLYVAITRAKQLLYCSAAHWYEGDAQKGPSAFWDEVASHESVVSLTVAEAPDTSPLLARMARDLVWPAAPAAPDATLRWVRIVEDLVAGRRTAEEVLEEGGAEARAAYDAHQALIGTLAAHADEPAAVPLHPRSLGATEALRLIAEKRPWRPSGSSLPERQSDAQRLGVEVHAWIEERSRGLLGLAAEDAVDEPALPLPDDEAQRLRSNFEAMGYPGRELAVLDSGEAMCELPFTLKVSNLLVRGRIDAVYTSPGDRGAGEAGLEVVDFKTGDQPDEPDRGQLELYAEALFELGIVRGPVRLTYAFLSTATNVSWQYTPSGIDSFAQRLAEVLPT